MIKDSKNIYNAFLKEFINLEVFKAYNWQSCQWQNNFTSIFVSRFFGNNDVLFECVANGSSIGSHLVLGNKA